MRKRSIATSGQSLESKLLLSVDEVAASLSLGRSLVYKLVMRGEIPSITVGRMRRIPVTCLHAYVSEQLSALQKGAEMPTKRGNSEGTIRKRADGRWEARITLENGARRSFYAKTRQEVARQLAEAARDREHGIQVVGERQTVREFLEGWVAATEHDVKPRTWRRRGEYVRLHIIPVVGKVHLQKLSAQHVEALYTRKLSEGLSPTTVHHVHEVLHVALERAVRLGLVYRNVTDMVHPPRMNHHEMTTLAESQAKALLAAAAGDHLEALYAVALATGMRLGELLALKWRDVDLDGRSLQVRATLQNIAGRFEFAEPKTSRSRRRIMLSRLATEALRQHQERQTAERLLAGGAWDDLDLVFPNTLGKPLDGRNLLRYWFRPLVNKARLPRMRFHDLRHTAATLLLSRGVNPKIVSEMLGHASVSITLDIYSHVMPHMQQQAADAMDAALADSSDSLGPD